MNNMQPSDQAERERFISEIDGNFSVIAPAGVGKTASIVERIVTLARRNEAALPKLLLVTYTKQAAAEMKQRVYARLLEGKLPHTARQAMDQAFFGTIHSFCVTLLQGYGYHLGLPTTLNLVEDEDQLWQQFMRSQPSLPKNIKDQLPPDFLRLISLRAVMSAARYLRPSATPTPTSSAMPALDFSALFDFVAKGSGKKNIAANLALLREWQSDLQEGRRGLELPKPSGKSEKFLVLWDEAFAPLQNWLSAHSYALAYQIYYAYRSYRLQRGLFTYADQINLAAELCQHPAVIDRLRAENWRVILDEAQDTDPWQFRVLTEITRPENARGLWLETQADPPRPGHFCMVGDPQQSIYGRERGASMGHYLKVHEGLCGENAKCKMHTALAAPAAAGIAKLNFGEALTFSVTFRCDQAIIDAVNTFGAKFLDGRAGQVALVPLQPRPDVTSGQVVRLEIDRDAADNADQDEVWEAQEARQLVAWIKAQGYQGLGARRWSEVALLCPRKKWLLPLQSALQAADLPCQIRAELLRKIEHPAHAWAAALIKVMDEPHNAFELAGVLREIFGHSDQALFDFCRVNKQVLQIENEITGDTALAHTLNQLRSIREDIDKLPLREACYQLWRRTQLRERLESLGPWNKADIQTQMDALLKQAATAEALGKTLSEFSARLRVHIQRTACPVPAPDNGIQLLTCHKAKGLQWDAVIVPYFFRPLKRPAPKAPVIIQTASDEQPFVALESTWVSDAAKARRDRFALQEDARLLYVTMTRARHTLVLVSDIALALKPGKSTVDSFAALFNLTDEDCQKYWQALSTANANSPHPQPLSQSSSKTSNADSSLGRGAHNPNQNESRESGVRGVVASGVRGNSPFHIPHSAFPHRILPHTLAHHTQPPTQNSAPSSPDGRPYGIWWHKVAETMPWKSDVSEWQRHVTSQMPTCPDPTRGQQEWKLFFSKSSAGPIKSAFRNPHCAILHTEMPFLLRTSTNECLEGLIDLAIWIPHEDRWLIVDWKTDQVNGNPQSPIPNPQLIDPYAPQIRAYAQSLSTLTQKKVSAYMYATATGEFLEIESL